MQRAKWVLHVVLGAALAVALQLVVQPEEAAAVPAFARATDLPCSACHTVWPKLNRFGRAFKENGYAVERGNAGKQLKIGDRLSIPTIPPVSVIFNGRPYDRKKGHNTKLRALHELELQVAGSILGYGSVFAELEMEDENNFDPELGHAWGGLHPYQFLNVIGGYGSIFTADPYNTLADRKITRGRPRGIDLGFEAGANLHGNTQFIGVSGRDPFSDRVFYMFTYSADRGDPEGVGTEDYTGRLAVDVTNELTVGTFGTFGRQDDLDFHRVGADAQLQYGPLNAELLYVQARDDLMLGATERDNNFAFSGQTYFVFDETVYPDLPSWFFKLVPLIRVDHFTVPGASQKRTDMTFNLTYLALENAKLSLEFFQQLSGEPGDSSTGSDERRVTMYFTVGL